MLGEHRNTIIAIALSLAIMVGWQFLIGIPQMRKEQEQAQLKQQEQSQTMPGQTKPAQPAQPSAGGTAPQAPGVPNAAAPSQAASRQTVIASSPRIAINTPVLGGSIDL